MIEPVPTGPGLRRRGVPLGATLLPGGRASLAVWAPAQPQLSVELLPRARGGAVRRIALDRSGDVHRTIVDDVAAGDRYRLVLADGLRIPDPRSRRQPEGVHGPSALVDPGRLAGRLPRPALPPPAQWILYELHAGAFSPEGTLDGVARRLSYLRRELGVTAIELMPVAAYPGDRNWGYDGVHPFAVHEGYGGPDALARLVEAAHREGLAVILDVVYNHLGPDGNYLRLLGPYFTDRHRTPWGDAVNFDGPGSEEVRAWAIENAVQWIVEHGLDGLRLDAIHAIHDASPRHVVAELTEAVQAAGGVVIAESDLNDPVTVAPRPAGWGCDAQWSDDLHHALHALLTGERTGYYVDFGAAGDVASAWAHGFVHDGTRPSAFRGGARHGRSAAGVPPGRHVVCLQNHDQVGNRARGDRIATIAGLEAAKAGAAAVLLAPGVPLVFMGEEYAAPQPFPYFTSYEEPALAEAVREGRRREFASFLWPGELPDPQADGTFRGAVLDLEQRRTPPHGGVLALYRRLIELRRTHPALAAPTEPGRIAARAGEEPALVVLERAGERGERLAVVLCAGTLAEEGVLPLSSGRWRLVLDTADAAFGGPGVTAPAELHVPSGGSIVVRLAPRAAWVYERIAADAAGRAVATIAGLS